MKYSIAYILFLFLFIPVSLCAQQTQEKRPKVGLVLGGGGAKGVADFIPKKIKQMIQRGEKAGENSRGILTKFNVSL